MQGAFALLDWEELERKTATAMWLRYLGKGRTPDGAGLVVAGVVGAVGFGADKMHMRRDRATKL